MNVMYAADDHYAELMGVSMLSLLEQNKQAEEICFYIVVDHISPENMDKVRFLAQQYGRKVTFLEKPDIKKLLGVELKTLRWSDSAYSRLFLKELFGDPPFIKKLLYLDCDTLILSSLQELWETDLENFLGAACLECMSNMHKKILGRKKEDNYFNSGVLLLNVDRWVKEDVQTSVIEFIRKHNGKTEYVDQGVINGVVCDRFCLAAPRYNLTSLAYDFTYEEMQIYRKPEFGYSRQAWEAAIKNPAVIHFTTSFLSVRPWDMGSEHPYTTKWREVHSRSPWKEKPLWILDKGKKRDLVGKVYRMLPAGFSVKIAGFLHAYVKPLWFILR